MEISSRAAGVETPLPTCTYCRRTPAPFRHEHYQTVPKGVRPTSKNVITVLVPVCSRCDDAAKRIHFGLDALIAALTQEPRLAKAELDDLQYRVVRRMHELLESMVPEPQEKRGRGRPPNPPKSFLSWAPLGKPGAKPRITLEDKRWLVYGVDRMKALAAAKGQRLSDRKALHLHVLDMFVKQYRRQGKTRDEAKDLARRRWRANEESTPLAARTCRNGDSCSRSLPEFPA